MLLEKLGISRSDMAELAAVARRAAVLTEAGYPEVLAWVDSLLLAPRLQVKTIVSFIYTNLLIIYIIKSIIN